MSRKRQYPTNRLLFCKRVSNFTYLVLLVFTVATNSLKAMGIETSASNQANTILPSIVMNDNFEDGSAFIEKMCSSAQALDNYSSAYEMVVYKENQTINEAGVFSFKQPRLMRVEVEKGAKKGSVAILALDGKVHGHLGGALKFFRAAVSPDSDLVKAANGFPMVNTDFYSLALYLQNMLKEGDHSRIAKEPLQSNKTSQPAYVLDIYSTKLDRASLLKRVYVDAQTFLPVYWEDYIEDKVWSESSWHDLKTNIEFPENFFKP